MMSGRSGVLHTGHCLFDTRTRFEQRELASTKVHFGELTEDEIDAYVATGEPLAVAGSFTVDGLGGAFVERIEGDHHNVVGLSLPLLRRMLAEVGIAWHSLWPLPAPRLEYDDAVAAGYDETRGGADRARAAAEAAHELLPKDGRLLDLAVGTGIVAAELAALGHLVHGVDLSPAMLRHASIRLPGHVALADAGRLPIAGRRVDAVTAIWLLHLVPDSDAVLAEVARVLRPDGVFVTTVDKSEASRVADGRTPPKDRSQDALSYLVARADAHGLRLDGATSFVGPARARRGPDLPAGQLPPRLRGGAAAYQMAPVATASAATVRTRAPGTSAPRTSAEASATTGPRTSAMVAGSNHRRTVLRSARA